MTNPLPLGWKATEVDGPEMTLHLREFLQVDLSTAQS